MGLFDVFSKGGKYFGKAIAPRCEYCESGDRSRSGDKVLCKKKGLVDPGYHCPKFVYSPLKRIPVKQMDLVGFLEGNYDEKNFDEEPVKKPAPKPEAEKPAPTAPKTEPKVEAKVEAEKPADAIVEPEKIKMPEPVVVDEPVPTPAVDAKKAADDLASLAAAAEAAGEYVADEADAPADEAEAPSPTAILGDM